MLPVACRTLSGLCVRLGIVFMMLAAPAFGVWVQTHNTRQNQDTLRVPRDTSETSERDRFIMSVFEALLSTMDAKLRRVENLDKAVEHLMRKMETLYSHVNQNIVKTEQVLSKLRAFDTKLYNVGNGKAVEALDMRMVSLDEKVNVLDNKISVLMDKLNQVWRVSQSSDRDELREEASERRIVRIDATPVNQDIQAVKDKVSEIENKLEVLKGEVTPMVGYLVNSVTEIHNAVIEVTGHEERSTTTTTTTTSSSVDPRKSNVTGRGSGGRLSRIDRLITRVDPIASVSEKMDEVWNVVVGTKSSVDNLVPKSEQLLDKTQRQERAISEIHSDLKNKTDKIIENLYMVERTIREKSGEGDLGKEQAFRAVIRSQPADGEHTDGPQVFIHSDVDELPLLPIMEPPEYPTRDRGSSSEEETEEPVDGPSYHFPSIVFPSILRKPAFLGNNSTDPALLKGTGYKVRMHVLKYKLRICNAYSCADLYEKGIRDSGVYYVQIRGTTYWYLKVYCNMDSNGGGWTVIQRRDDFHEPRESFNREWDDYKHGFGDPSKELWLGNENIFMLTNSEDCILRVELEDFDGNKRWAEYTTFKLYSEKDDYKLEIGGYEGNAGDSLNDPWYGSNLSPFSTFDRDNDRSSLNCASMLKGGWWWRSCGRGLNGLYIADPNDLQARQE
ncbi:unnamed protein product [Darwinula stevensoni]|uniref:Fibrinogen C-terminal domain-containing protein n=1 Tax=Darwinula stevensoni TaxID=69355 RepID=A0A7R8X640_9CRUS|nr:unnamed protein product [Darwinula stevensoni]CAG0885516.1 unnamed protein product [Darwinula stevensoni]